MAHNSLSTYTVYYIVRLCNKDFTSLYCDSEVTVNTCTCTDVFIIITMKDQSGGIYNDHSTDGQGFMAVVKKNSSSGYTLGLGLFTAINLWYLCYSYNVSTNVLHIQFLLDISPALKREVQFVITFVYFQVC